MFFSFSDALEHVMDTTSQHVLYGNKKRKKSKSHVYTMGKNVLSLDEKSTTE